MNVYVVIKKGVYRHRIIGVWKTLATAQLEAGRAILKEPDNYHVMQVVETPLDEVATIDELGEEEDKVIATLRRDKSNPPKLEWK